MSTEKLSDLRRQYRAATERVTDLVESDASKEQLKEACLHELAMRRASELQEQTIIKAQRGEVVHAAEWTATELAERFASLEAQVAELLQASRGQSFNVSQ